MIFRWILLILALGYAVAGVAGVYRVPCETVGQRVMLEIRIGDLTIPKIMLDTGFTFDGLII